MMIVIEEGKIKIDSIIPQDGRYKFKVGNNFKKHIVTYIYDKSKMSRLEKVLDKLKNGDWDDGETQHELRSKLTVSDKKYQDRHVANDLVLLWNKPHDNGNDSDEIELYDIGSHTRTRIGSSLNRNNMMPIIDESNRFVKRNKALFGDPTGKIKTFAIISPENPLGYRHSTDEESIEKYRNWLISKNIYNQKVLDDMKHNINAGKDFKQYADAIKKGGQTTLRYGHFDYVPISGHYEESEHSFLIFNISYNDAERIARDFGQESFYYGNTKSDKSIIGYYETDDGCRTYKLMDKSSTITFENEATDYFSKFGDKFRINMSIYGDDVVDVSDEVLEDFGTTAKYRDMIRRNRFYKN